MKYEIIRERDAYLVKSLCNELMVYQKSKAKITPERFDSMSFETRLLPSLEKADKNFIMIAKDDDEVVGYVYCNLSAKEVYDNDFATFFDINSVEDQVGCLSQFFIKDGYRGSGIGTRLFNEGMKWLNQLDVKDLFIFVSNGNDNALSFYKHKGFKESHKILDGFITVLRNM
ncbi:GNAT family N-acetyltransferase [Abyssisolibacter fermentans]|uniref:GNAT family N-acetyltransferase n=1 Tax=Abyssisolibacter fermentans TaxID=1766203 RepID=UPI00192E370E|nr:GNAT family N-acetyltransferase [Abyssisolibacter fermentans]